MKFLCKVCFSIFIPSILSWIKSQRFLENVIWIVRIFSNSYFSLTISISDENSDQLHGVTLSKLYSNSNSFFLVLVFRFYALIYFPFVWVWIGCLILVFLSSHLGFPSPFSKRQGRSVVWGGPREKWHVILIYVYSEEIKQC